MVSSPGSSTPSATPSINIIGAGIAGLSLACHLRRRRIPFNIFDAASKPKGHNYGITISPWGYKELLNSLEPKLTTQSLRESTAVDRLIGGQGFTTAPSKTDRRHDALDEFRVSDTVQRNLLAKGHHIKWDHKVTSIERVTEGLKLTFENGSNSTANITVDAGGERSGLLSLLLPDLEPTVLPYAVYHGSRYIAQSTFDEQYNDIFEPGQNVKNFNLQSPNKSHWHLQIARTYITQDALPSKVKLDTTDKDDLVVELRYTFSRPAKTSSSEPDPLYNPTRSPSAAKNPPEALYSELSTLLSSSSAHLPPQLLDLLGPNKLQSDRILNWLMRLKPQLLESSNLQTLAANNVVAIGDSIHATPPLGSEGASHAMTDAGEVAEWIGRLEGKGNLVEEEVMRFYETRVEGWKGAVKRAEERLLELHRVEPRLSGRI